MYFDGAVNVYENRKGAIWISSTGAHIHVATQLRFPYTNNIAEYKYKFRVLKAALYMNMKDLEVYEDSTLIISQPAVTWEVRNLE